MKWIRTEDVQSGDIIETISKIPEHSPIFKGMMLPIIKHYGIVCNVNGEQCLVHNIIGRSPTITPCREVFTDRSVERVLRTGLTDEEILDKYYSCREKKYDLWSWNCESLMVFIWGDSIGIPQRDAWSVGATILIILLLLVIISRQQKS